MVLITLIICAAAPAVAQIDLTITVAESGNFIPGIGCSKYSPQFVNEIQVPALNPPFVGSHRAPSIPAECIDTKVIWVMNKGTVATTGVVTVQDTMTAEQPKGSTVLTVNGYCGWDGTGSVSGGYWCNGVNPNGPFNPIPANRIAANGWTCNVAQGKFTCQRSDALAPGATYPAITVRVLREDFSPLSCFNNLAVVSGGGFDIDPTNNAQFDDFISSYTVNQLKYAQLVAINSVPMGRKVRVDGSVVTTPHYYAWEYGSLHTIEGEDNPQVDAVCSAPIPGTGTPLTGNAGYTVVGYTSNGLLATGTSGVGCQNPVSFTLPEFITGAFFYEAVTVRFKQP